MDPNIPSDIDTESVNAKAADVGVTPSLTDSDVETAANMERPTEVISKDTGQKKRSKKRKHKKSVDAGESSVPKKKLSKEERTAKKARKAEGRGRRVAQKEADAEAAEDNVPEEAEESVPEEMRSFDVQLVVDEEAQESDEEDIAPSSLARKSVLEARLRSLSGEDDPNADPVGGDSGGKAPQA
ncbi:hypothetical protein LIER_12059 [Lithospermum erythrorhizon]|uniref:Uncharacterized protein n=1 Tax=Lithospermum erythrorhizon TaxID=34254 RepID=A0AAV3PSA0_LITER